MHLGTADADETLMKQIVQPLSVNPWLGLAVKGMWTTKPVQAVIADTDQKHPEPSTEPASAYGRPTWFPSNIRRIRLRLPTAKL